MKVIKALLFISAIWFIPTVFSGGQTESLRYGNALAADVHKSSETQEIRGKVQKVIPADLDAETRPKILILGQDAKIHTFIVRSTTTIYDPQWKPTTLDRIAAGQYVRIRYRIDKNGFAIARSIKPSRISSIP